MGDEHRWMRFADPATYRAKILDRVTGVEWFADEATPQSAIDAGYQPPATGAAAERNRRPARIRACAAPLRERDEEMLITGTLGPSVALSTVQRWDADLRARDRRPRRILVLVGDAGLGKTLSGVWWVTCSPSASRPARGRAAAVYARMRDLSPHFTAHFGEPDEHFRRALGARMLVVDELGLERSVGQLERARDVLLELIDHRATRRYATILISNGTVDEFRARFGANGEDQRMLGRLDADATFVQLAGQSLRPGASS